jgi:hypothetical protein
MRTRTILTALPGAVFVALGLAATPAAADTILLSCMDPRGGTPSDLVIDTDAGTVGNPSTGWTHPATITDSTVSWSISFPNGQVNEYSIDRNTGVETNYSAERLPHTYTEICKKTQRAF